MIDNEKTVTLGFSPKEFKCKDCVFSLGTPYNVNCPKYKLKPREVLYEGKDCPKFKAYEFDRTEDEDFEDEE